MKKRWQKLSSPPLHNTHFFFWSGKVIFIKKSQEQKQYSRAENMYRKNQRNFRTDKRLHNHESKDEFFGMRFFAKSQLQVLPFNSSKILSEVNSTTSKTNLFLAFQINQTTQSQIRCNFWAFFTSKKSRMYKEVWFQIIMLGEWCPQPTVAVTPYTCSPRTRKKDMICWFLRIPAYRTHSEVSGLKNVPSLKIYFGITIRLNNTTFL